MKLALMAYGWRDLRGRIYDVASSRSSDSDSRVILDDNDGTFTQ